MNKPSQKIENPEIDNMKEEVEKIVKNEYLIEMQPSLDGLRDNLDTNDPGSVYYGTGLVTPNAMTQGLPFDVLSMILVSEKLKRKAGFKETFHHVADTHAKTNEWADPKKVDDKAKEVRSTLRTVADNLKLDNFNIVLASEFDQTEEYRSILREFESSEEHDYVKREIADMEWYKRKHGVSMKAGWIIQARETSIGFDERRFDREYRRFKGENSLSFIYIKPGRTFDLSRPKVSPYITVPGEHRLLLDPNEDVRKKFESAIERTGDYHLGGARKHLKKIVRTYEQLFDRFDRDIELEDKLQGIIDTCFGK